ncbi:protein JINGUBANG-like [Camellia sinensis]|uniref:protein JINGUBANG-like n=1 Tax=Camellia sinensis TaxID=4442 RepID=UPI001036F1F1|nr:protein JINGUBANG-like [Camellia sinensis]
MKFRSWLSTCSSATSYDPTPPPPPPPKPLFFDTSSSSDIPESLSSTSHDTSYSSSSLQNNLSLQTLPSVPSLQTLTLSLASHHHYHRLESSPLVATLPTVNDRLLRFAFPANYVKVRRHRKWLWIEHHDAVSGLEVIDGLNLMCSVSWDKCLKIWRVSDLRCVQSIKAHDDAINAVAVAIDGTIYTASADRRIKVWGRASGERKYGLIASLEKHKSAVNSLALNDGRQYWDDDDDIDTGEYNIGNEENIGSSDDLQTEKDIKCIDQLTEKDVFEMTFDSVEN